MNQLQKLQDSKVAKILFVSTLVLFVLAPLQGFITMWPPSLVGHQLFWQAIKELILIVPVFAVVYLVIKNQQLKKWFEGERLFWLIGLYILLHVILFLINRQDAHSGIMGLVLNLRFLIFFVTSYVLGYVFKNKVLNKAVYFVVIIAFFVSLFGVLQMTILPSNFLAHLGYNGKPIPAGFYIDSDLQSIRIASTTRGPNNLGAYLIVPLSFCVATTVSIVSKRKKLRFKEDHLLYGVTLILGTTALYGTHSRSALIGFILAIFVWFGLTLHSKGRGLLLGLFLGAVLLTGFTAYSIKDSSFFHTVVLHDVKNVGGKATSNQAHLSALKAGVQNVKDDKFVGCGPGCAGPASVRSTRGAQISENYYVQIAEETGIAGIILFIAITTIIARRLYILRGFEPAASALLAALIGISVVNLLLHTWADDSLAYVWWGLAGMLIGSYSHLGSETASATHRRTSDLKISSSAN